jgi:hypothetical protein
VQYCGKVTSFFPVSLPLGDNLYVDIVLLNSSTQCDRRLAVADTGKNTNNSGI